MARQKGDGRGRLGGRSKGTPNKITASLREWIASIIDKNRSQIEIDLKVLEPRDRLQVLERLMQYVIPKQKEVESKVTVNEKDHGYFDLLPDDELFEIADKLQEAQHQYEMMKRGKAN